MPSSVFANAVTTPSKSKKRMRSTSAWHLECWWCQKHLSERDETTVYSELFGNQQVHRCCSGPAQDHMDDEFNNFVDDVVEHVIERVDKDKHDGSKDVADKDKDAKDAEKDGSIRPK